MDGLTFVDRLNGATKSMPAAFPIFTYILYSIIIFFGYVFGLVPPINARFAAAPFAFSALSKNFPGAVLKYMVSGVTAPSAGPAEGVKGVEEAFAFTNTGFNPPAFALTTPFAASNDASKIVTVSLTVTVYVRSSPLAAVTVKEYGSV